MPQKIGSIYCYVMTEDNGDEGIPAASAYIDGRLMFLPMVGADLERVKSLLPRVQEISNATGKSFRLMKFSEAEDITHTL